MSSYSLALQALNYSPKGKFLEKGPLNIWFIRHLKNKHRDYHCYFNSHWGGFRVKALIVAQPMDWFSLASASGLEISFYSSGLQNKGGVQGESLGLKEEKVRISDIFLNPKRKMKSSSSNIYYLDWHRHPLSGHVPEGHTEQCIYRPPREAGSTKCREGENQKHYPRLFAFSTL